MKPTYKEQITGHEIADEIKKLRLTKGLTLKDLALQTGLSVFLIRNLEDGYVNAPNPEVVRKLKDVLEV